jgi:hypothetical protein
MNSQILDTANWIVSMTENTKTILFAAFMLVMFNVAWWALFFMM